MKIEESNVHYSQELTKQIHKKERRRIQRYHSMVQLKCMICLKMLKCLVCLEISWAKSQFTLYCKRYGKVTNWQCMQVKIRCFFTLSP